MRLRCTAGRTLSSNACWGTTLSRRQEPPAGGLNAAGGLVRPVAMGPNKVEDAAAEFNSRVQIASPPPDQISVSRLTPRFVLKVGRGDPVRVPRRPLHQLDPVAVGVREP